MKGIRSIGRKGQSAPSGLATFHNAADRPIRFYAGWMDDWIEMDPGSEIQVPIGLTRDADRQKRVKPSKRIGGKRALYYVCPYLAEGKAPVPFQGEPIKIDRVKGVVSNDDSELVSAPAASAPREAAPVAQGVQAQADAPQPDQRPHSDAVAKLVAEHTKDELVALGRSLDLKVDKRMSEETVAQALVDAGWTE